MIIMVASLLSIITGGWPRSNTFALLKSISFLQKFRRSSLRGLVCLSEKDNYWIQSRSRSSSRVTELRNIGFVDHINLNRPTRSMMSMSSSSAEDQDQVFYPPIEPFDSGFLQVSPIHSLYYEQCGSTNGNPIIFL